MNKRIFFECPPPAGINKSFQELKNSIPTANSCTANRIFAPRSLATAENHKFFEQINNYRADTHVNEFQIEIDASSDNIIG